MEKAKFMSNECAGNKQDIISGMAVQKIPVDLLFIIHAH